MSVDSLVIDASAALYAAASDQGFAGIAADTLLAPALLWSECTSVLREMHHRGEISPALRDTALARIVGGRIQKRSPRQLYVEATRIAADLGWAKTYDAEYVALARIILAATMKPCRFVLCGQPPRVVGILAARAQPRPLLLL